MVCSRERRGQVPKKQSNEWASCFGSTHCLCTEMSPTKVCGQFAAEWCTEEGRLGESLRHESGASCHTRAPAKYKSGSCARFQVCSCDDASLSFANLFCSPCKYVCALKNVVKYLKITCNLSYLRVCWSHHDVFSCSPLDVHDRPNLAR